MGHHNIRFVGDPNASNGIWGYPTSAANFCEEDYAVTTYIAEFINTLTNLAYIYLAFKSKLDFMSISLFILGVCSFGFHATMHQATQYFDDLSMFILGTSLVYQLYIYNQSIRRQQIITIVLFTSMTIVSMIYVWSGEILFHTFVFMTLLTMVWPRTLYIMFMENKSHLMKKFGKAVIILIIGYILWNIDLEKCLELRKFKNQLGLPWSWIFELHGWWHILTAIGAYEYMELIRDLCYKEKKL